MSVTTPEDTQPKKKKSKVKALVIGLLAVTVLGGAGAAGGFYVAGNMVGSAKAADDPNTPKIMLKDGTAVGAEEAGTAIPDQSKNRFKITYHQIEEPFTSNLTHSESYTQLSLAVSTYYDERVIQNVVDHEIAIRSAVLMQLSQQDPFELDTNEGKLKLKKELREVINATLKDKTGFGGIEDVYFTSMVIQ